MTYPEVVDLSVTIDGNEVKTEILDGRIVYRDLLGALADSWNFTLIDPAVTPNDWDEVIVYDGATKLLGGYIVEIVKRRIDRNNSKSIMYRIHCGSYAARLERTRIKEEFANKTDAYIIDDVLTEHASWLDGTTHVNEVKTYVNKRFNRVSVYQAIDNLAEEAGANWYVDEDKKLHFFLSEEGLAPFDISDSPDYSTTYSASNIEIITDGSGVCNKVEVVGGNYLSADTTDYYSGTNKSEKISLYYPYHAPDGESSVQIWRNDGTEGTPNWTSLTVKVGHVDSITTTSECLYYYQERLVEQLNDWPELPNAMKVTGQFEAPLITRMTDDASYIHYSMWFEQIIIDETIINKEDSKIAGRTKLAQSSLATTSIIFDTMAHGLKAGQTIHILNSELGLDDDYFIHKVHCSIERGGFAKYTVTLGTYNPELADYILALARRTDDTPWREDEVLNEILDQSEDLDLAESWSSVATGEPPYTWGPTGTNDFEWGFGTWST